MSLLNAQGLQHLGSHRGISSMLNYHNRSATFGHAPNFVYQLSTGIIRVFPHHQQSRNSIWTKSTSFVAHRIQIAREFGLKEVDRADKNEPFCHRKKFPKQLGQNCSRAIQPSQVADMQAIGSNSRSRYNARFNVSLLTKLF
ncbi:MAG TPA: hypothetical protein VGJ15_04810 [Pirellulales bacterium]